MTTFKVPNKTLTILRKNCLKLLHTNGSLVTYWRLPTHFQWKAFLLQNLKAIKVSNCQLQNYKTVLNFGGCVNVCVWRFWWCQRKKQHKFTSSPNQNQVNKRSREKICLSLLLLKESLNDWQGLASKHNF